MWLDWLRPGIEDATEAELIEDLKAGRAQLWPGDTAAMVTQVLDNQDGRALHVWIAGGALDGILALKPGVEAWGRAMGCNYVSINSRPGWTRLLRDDGFALVGEELRKLL